MSDQPSHPLEAILRQCAQAAPQPWYPKAFAETFNIPRDSLDPHLDRLRLAGLIQLTDWVPDHGQGYELTDDGQRLLRDPRGMARLRTGQLPDTAPEAWEPRARRAGAMTPFERGETIREALLNPIPARVTRMLLWANIVVFVAGYFLARQQNVPDAAYLYQPATGQQQRQVAEVVHQLGGIRGADLAAGEWWRLLTACFVHFGLVHLAANMFSLYMVGPLIERLWGHARFLVVYLVAGVVGSCAMVLATPVGIGGGASGALWGLMAAMAAWVVLNRAYLPPALVSNWLGQLGMVFVINLFISFMPGISFGAHFGGGIAGLLTAALLNAHRFGGRGVRWLAVLGVVAVPVAGVVAVVAAPRFDPRWQVAEQQARALAQWAEQRARNERENREIDDFNANILGKTQSVERHFTNLYEEQVETLLTRPPDRRNPRAVAQALERLAQIQTKLQEAHAAVAQAGPYQTARLAEAQELYRTLLDAQRQLAEQFGQCLRAGDRWTGAEDKALRNQQRETEKLYRQWRRFLSGNT